MRKLIWKRHAGVPGIQAPLSTAGHYVISHRPGEHTVAYRPPGEHHSVGNYKSAVVAKGAAAHHHGLLATHGANEIGDNNAHIVQGPRGRFEKHQGWIATCPRCSE